MLLLCLSIVIFQTLAMAFEVKQNDDRAVSLIFQVSDVEDESDYFEIKYITIIMKIWKPNIPNIEIKHILQYYKALSNDRENNMR